MTKGEKLNDRVREEMADFPKVEEKHMFGGTCFMLNGKMCIGVVEDEIMCRIGPDIYEEALEKTGCRGGKYCSACNTIVLDLTSKTNQEILELISKNGSVCGKVTKSQLQPPLNRKSYFQKIFASLFMTLGLSGLSKALFSQDFKFEVETSDSIVELGESDDQIGIIAEETTFVGVIYSKPPQYKYGGEEGLWKFLEENLVYPKDRIEGKVYVTFTVNECGEVENAKVPRSLSVEADKEVLRVVQMLEFIPGEMSGKPTKINYQLPIIFKLK